jgi:hypothetical protein
MSLEPEVEGYGSNDEKTEYITRYLQESFTKAPARQGAEMF